ncbi:MAG: dCMP deaminase family protein [bacterium]|nr:dCMP deaminase family protein [bacterium]
MPGKREEYLTWDEYFMGQALEISLRSKDPSTQVGACIANDENKQVSVGYNGLPVGMDDDDFYWNSPGEESGDLFTTKNPWVVHAEINAILNCKGTKLDGTTLYVTLFPCNECAKSIIQAGIKKVVYLRMYDKDVLVEITKTMFDLAGVEYIPFNKNRSFSKADVQNATNEIQKILKRFSV